MLEAIIRATQETSEVVYLKEPRFEDADDEFIFQQAASRHQDAIIERRLRTMPQGDARMLQSRVTAHKDTGCVYVESSPLVGTKSRLVKLVHLTSTHQAPAAAPGLLRH